MSDLVRGLDPKPTGTPPTPDKPPVTAPTPREPAAAPPTPGQPAPAAPPPPLPPRPEPAPGRSASPSPSSGEAPERFVAEVQAELTDVRELVLRGATAVPWGRLGSLVERAAASLRASADLFWFATSAPPGVDYVASHQATVMVLAIRLGVSLGYDRARLLDLGLAACLMDAALWEMPEAAVRRLDSLVGQEATAYQAHPRRSAEIVHGWGPPSERIATAILQHHEREHGQGFPQGFSGASIDADAKILGLVDTYTLLTVPPASRPRLRPHEAIRDIVKARQDAFPSALIKALLSEISVFPPGTIVRLNTDEVGRVIAVNRNHPLRPKVEIMADGKGHRVVGPKIVDLSEAPFLYITGPVAEGTR